MVDDLLCPPGRQNRPPKIAIILRGPPGSGKSFVAKLIKVKLYLLRYNLLCLINNDTISNISFYRIRKLNKEVPHQEY